VTEDELAWEPVDVQTSYACDGFEVITEQVRLPDGTETDFDYLREGESVVILAFTTNDEVVVIEEWREAVDRVVFGLPAGSIRDDEDPAAAVDRELAEETGYEAGPVEHLATFEPANGFADSLFHYYVARECTATGEQDLDHDESIRVSTTDFSELTTAIRDGTLRDGRSALGIMYAALFNDVSGRSSS
jgi:ADP-ribose pyrophosphatase